TQPISYSTGAKIKHTLDFFEQNGVRAKLYTGRLRYGEKSDQPTCPEFLEAIEQRKLCGVVAGMIQKNSQWLEQLRKIGVPVVGNDLDFSFSVVQDSGNLIEDGIRYLLKQGRRKIAWM